jgi:DNA-binding NarL/FixJ family response regulator
MGNKPMTVIEMARLGGLARAKAYTKAQLRAFAKNAGRKPWKLTPTRERSILAHVAKGWTHPRIAAKFQVSLRTIGRVVARQKQRGASRKEGM